MRLILGILFFCIMITVIVAIHEAGHLIVAKKCGVYCPEFAIGMGPVIYKKAGEPDESKRTSKWSKIWKETAFSIRLYPVGGYVQMAGDDGEEFSREEYKGRRLNDKGIGKQTAIMIAGVVMNLILAVVCYVSFYMVTPQIPSSDPLPIIEEVVKGSPAEKAGLMKGDRIVHVQNGSKSQKIETDLDLTEFLQGYNTTSTFTILRNGKEMKVDMKPVKTKYGYTLGYVGKGVEKKDGNIGERMDVAFKDISTTSDSMITTIGMMGTGKGYESLSGPIGIIQLITDIVLEAPQMLLYMVGVISLNLSFMNILPIPALDGGRIALLWLNKLTGDRIKQGFLEGAIGISFICLMGLMVFIFWNDIMRLFL